MANLLHNSDSNQYLSRTLALSFHSANIAQDNLRVSVQLTYPAAHYKLCDSVVHAFRP